MYLTRSRNKVSDCKCRNGLHGNENDRDLPCDHYPEEVLIHVPIEATIRFLCLSGQHLRIRDTCQSFPSSSMAQPPTLTSSHSRQQPEQPSPPLEPQAPRPDILPSQSHKYVLTLHSHFSRFLHLYRYLLLSLISRIPGVYGWRM
jgi:hypothetical protein